MFHFKTYVPKESYHKTASFYIAEIICTEDPRPMEYVHVKRNPYIVCARRNIRKSRGVSTDLWDNIRGIGVQDKRQYPGDLGRNASQGFCSNINLFTLLSAF